MHLCSWCASKGNKGRGKRRRRRAKANGERGEGISESRTRIIQSVIYPLYVGKAGGRLKVVEVVEGDQRSEPASAGGEVREDCGRGVPAF